MICLVKRVHLSASRSDQNHKERFFFKTGTPLLPPHDPPNPNRIKALPPPQKKFFLQSPKVPDGIMINIRMIYAQMG